LTAAPATDRYNNPEPDWDHATEQDTAGWLQSTSAIEQLGDRDTVISYHTLYLPADAPVQATDRLRIEGITYEVDGVPRTARTPSGPHHLELSLQVVEDIHEGAR